MLQWPNSLARWRLAWLALPWLLAGCAQDSQLGYYWQGLRGHLALMQAARPLPAWIADDATPAALRERLELAQRARAFAVDTLHLPDNGSYRRYADLGRPAAVWNVVAAPPDALTLHRWCFPLTGCIGYRGYFTEAGAQAQARALAAQGLEVSVYGVPAYSTLGYLNWLGGDPLLSTFVHWPEGDFVRLMFHELAHQVVYAEGDTPFNESFATAVERAGGALWLSHHASTAAQAADRASQARRAQFRQLTRATRARLAEIYAQKSASSLTSQALEAMKSEAMQDFRTRYAALRAQWLAAAPQAAPTLAGYDRWVAQANNAAFAAQAAYDGWADAFEALLRREGNDWPRFYDAVRKMAALPAAQRLQALCALQPAAPKEFACVPHPNPSPPPAGP